MSALIGNSPRIRLDNRVGAVDAMCYCTHLWCITLYRLFQCLDFVSIPVSVIHPHTAALFTLRPIIATISFSRSNVDVATLYDANAKGFHPNLVYPLARAGGMAHLSRRQRAVAAPCRSRALKRQLSVPQFLGYDLDPDPCYGDAQPCNDGLGSYNCVDVKVSP
jgi:hypothetical protein